MEDIMDNNYKLFNEKIDSFKEHKAYNEWLRKYADDAIFWNEMSGYLMIKAEDFIIQALDLMTRNG